MEKNYKEIEFGHPSGKAQKTHWVTFMKRAGKNLEKVDAQTSLWNTNLSKNFKLNQRGGDSLKYYDSLF